MSQIIKEIRKLKDKIHKSFNSRPIKRMFRKIKKKFNSIKNKKKIYKICLREYISKTSFHGLHYIFDVRKQLLDL